MSQPAPSLIHSHWYNLVAGFQYSAQDYYAQLEQALQPHQIPDVSVSRIEYREGGVFSAKRVYLRIQRDRLVFDICGAPFGTGFFFSWWLGELRGANIFTVIAVLTAFLILCAIVLSLFGAILTSLFGYFMGSFLTFCTLPLFAWLLGLYIRENPMGIEDTILELPVIGPLYQKLFRPVTYYKIDTALMFQSAVHSVVLEVIDGITQAQGLRALSEAERKPIMREFYQK